VKTDRFDTYQRESRKTWNVIPMNHPIVYPTMGLVNETGELAGKIKKIFRDHNGEIGETERQALKGELGDILWYLAQICTELDLSLEEVAEANLTKLFSRLERGVIRGDGDNR
jgi:NTP pyrophosphatase (non-canonical NTP hydrolase)